ncbi:MAG: response regulator transcription factor [Phyllobacterium sp.]|uniref:helix-turn-helix transcriptional regulator n=1 Tax=Phyllobacterium sp. TaxID=1871046 RepID=UPI0030F28D80
MTGELERGRAHYKRQKWAGAFRVLSVADRTAPLGGGDLELLAMSAYLIGRDDDYLAILERAHHAHLDSHERRQAVRCAFWLGFRVLLRGEVGRATGWFARAQRILEDEDRECAEQGYLLTPVVEQQIAAGELEAAYACAARAADIGVRCDDADLVACARHQQGRVRVAQGRVEEGLALLDEVMVAVTAGELSLLVTGLMYCSVIETCQAVYALGRAREWTVALTRWCEPDMVAFTGICRVHRAEILQLHGDWQGAIEEAQRAGALRFEGIAKKTAAAASYQQAEVHRLRGEFAAAERAYRSASAGGFDPQPGLALLRLAEGRIDSAAAAISRALGGSTDRLGRARLLPARVEIMLAAGDPQGAEGPCAELEATAQSFNTDALRAMAAHTRGAVHLGRGAIEAALCSLRLASDFWQLAEAPYHTARARELTGQACRSLGDEEGAALELAAAAAVYRELGATPDLARLESIQGAAPDLRHGLTKRELQVLRLVAAGDTNRAIAAELFLSERTIERHLSNIFTKLDLSTRAAATAWAYEHGLI